MAAAVDRVNPVYIPRNHRVGGAGQGGQGRDGALPLVLRTLSCPFDEQPIGGLHRSAPSGLRPVRHLLRHLSMGFEDIEGRSTRLLGAGCPVRRNALGVAVRGGRASGRPSMRSGRTTWRSECGHQVEDLLPGKIIQQPPPGLAAGSQGADPAAAFEDGQPGLVRAGDSRDPPAHLHGKGVTAGSDHAVVVADPPSHNADPA